jgi:hypothetical protein
MSKTGWVWVWFVFMIILDLVIPWTALTHVQALGGAFTFWIIWVIVAIISAFVILPKWMEVKR